MRASNKGLRKGFTTGACAAAASRAAARSLVTGNPVSSITIPLPDKEIKSHRFNIEICRIYKSSATCAVRKFAGDDPDCTDKALILSRVSWKKSTGIEIRGGSGVGKITKPGLGMPVGSPAINPVPLKMIYENVLMELSNPNKLNGVIVTISVQNGENISLRTLNSRLGILGGISILGRTGIVRPFSTAAYRRSIEQAIDVACAAHNDVIVLTTGRKSEVFAMKILNERSASLPPEAYIQMGDFTGAALKYAKKKCIRKIILCGMIGKFSKIANGVMQTHASGSRVDNKFLAHLAENIHADESTIKKILVSNTARHAGDILLNAGYHSFFEELCKYAAKTSYNFVDGSISIETILTDFDEGKILGHYEEKN